jgi:hypothetical protein
MNTKLGSIINGVFGSDVYSIFKPGFIQKPEIRIQVE